MPLGANMRGDVEDGRRGHPYCGLFIPSRYLLKRPHTRPHGSNLRMPSRSARPPHRPVRAKSDKARKFSHTPQMNAYLRSVTFAGLIATDYGRVLALKVLLIFVLLGVAAANRWIFLRRLR
jgi:hypothetical protein